MPGPAFPELSRYEVLSRHEDGETWGHNVESLSDAVTMVNNDREDGDGSVTYSIWDKAENRVVTRSDVKAAGIRI